MTRRLQTVLLLYMVVTATAFGSDYPTYKSVGSTYVPLDSWIYPVFDRLAALGYMPTAFAGLRPWTRSECARLVGEAQDLISAEDAEREQGRMLTVLSREFAGEIEGAQPHRAELESVYAGTTAIAGTPLVDGYHFSQTITNDYGRPYWQGINGTLGFAARLVAGPVSGYVRSEYQHAPSIPAASDAALKLISAFDRLPDEAGITVSEANRFRVLDAYVALTSHNTKISFGKQEFWWGPGEHGAMLLSNNAEPFYALRLNRVLPYKLPGFLGLLGPMRVDSFLGQLSGHRFVAPDTKNVIGPPVHPQPYIHGQKISFKPTPNLELGFSRTVVFGGPGFPLTAGTLWRSMSSTGNGITARDPGDRRAGFDFSYRVPGLRRWLTLYSDSMAEDEATPLLYPHRSAFNPGIYLARLPFLPRVDLRAEAAYTDPPPLRETGFFYYNLHYRGGYTNGGNLLGSWVGREGRGVQITSTYWFSAVNTLRFGYRGGWVDPEFMRGGRLNDFSVTSVTALGRNLTLRAGVQYEAWRFSLLSAAGETNLTASLQVTWWPSSRIQ
jgi:hypothetical protein